MSEDKYYVISNSDGDTYVYEYTKEKLEEEINSEGWGKEDFIDKLIKRDTNYWGEASLIIKGKIIVPKEKEVVVRREIE